MTTPNEQQLFRTNPGKWLHEISGGPDLFCIVIFRGSWCKYDRHYLPSLGKYLMTLDEKIQIVAWTSEGEAGARKADKEWGLTKECGYDAVLGDETNALAFYLKEECILPDLVIDSPTKNYPNGMAQPGMVWYAHHGKPVLEWVGLVAAGRPHPADILPEIKKRKHALDSGCAVLPSHGRKVRLVATDLDLLASGVAA